MVPAAPFAHRDFTQSLINFNLVPIQLKVFRNDSDRLQCPTSRRTAKP
jgi:hypothetical protein